MSSIRTKSRLAAGVTLAAAAVAVGSVFGASAATAAAPVADMEVFASPAQDPVGPGANFTLNVRAVNNGDATADGVRVTAALPAGVTLASEDQLFWNCEASTATNVDCVYLADLGPGSFVELPVRVAVAHDYAKSRFTVPVRVSTTSPESNTQNNSADTVVRVSKRVVADVYATASASPARVAPGGTFQLELGGGNQGNTAAEDIRFTSVLPAGLELVAPLPGGAYNCEASTSTKLDCIFAGDLEPGAFVSVSTTVRVTEGYTKRTASVPVTISTTNRETKRANNTAVATVRVTQS
jgi:uncharacterized repeat protein (TIGR01451 family)